MEKQEPIKLWLDDVRDPVKYGAYGYTWVKTVDEAKPLLETGRVITASLDHDLGACESCMEQWRDKDYAVSMPNCEHFGTGYTLVTWMEETGNWPLSKPNVHSANPVGAARMRQVINKAWRPEGYCTNERHSTPCPRPCVACKEECDESLEREQP